jgi:outer membrane protein assembly factor BamB
MVQSSPAVTDGYVFVGSRDSQVYCLNASNGEPVWKYPIRMEVWSSPAIYNDRVYVGADDGYLYCLNITTGIPVWRAPVGGPVRSSPTVEDGYVYIGSGDHDVFCLNATDGSTMWKFPTLTPVDSSPAFSGGVVYVVTGDDFIYAINASTGSEVWSHPIKSTVCSPAVYNGYVYAGSYDGYVIALNSSTGTQIWHYQTGGEVDSSPAVAYGYVYVGSQDNNIYCLNATNGHKIWQSATGYWVTSSPAVADGNVYIGSEDNNIYCLNASTGVKEWSYTTGNYVESSPAITNGTLYIGSDDFNVYAFALCNSTVSLPLRAKANALPWTTVAFDATACAIGGIAIFAVARFVYSTKRNKRKGEATDISGQKYSWFFTHSDAVFVLVILAFSTIFFINLGSGALWAADEQTYSQWAFHMVKSGDYLTPWAYGDLSFWISKPPLNMWLMSLSYQAFGVTNFASRLWSSIFGTLSLVVVYFLGKKLYNPYIGFASAIVLGTFTTFFAFARHAMTDLPFAFFVLASIYFFISSDKIGKTNRYAALSGVFFGLALMTKQVEALLIPLILFAYLLVTKKSIRFLFTKHFTLFWGIALLVFAPWLIYMNISFGSDFWQSYFMYGAVTRTVSPIEGHVGGYLFYFNYLVYNENPLWVILLPFAAGLCAFNSVIKRSKGDTLILAWMSIVLLVFTFAQTKLYWYILPAFPAFAIAISSFLYEVSKKIRARHRLTSSKSKAS